MGSLNFGNDSSKEKYMEFLQDYDDYLKDVLSIQKALRVAISSWHLVDWTFDEHKLIHKCMSIGDFRKKLYLKCASLKIMHDLANASKHKNLTRPKANIKNTKMYQGDFCPQDFSSEDYNVSYLEIEKNDGHKLSFKNEITLVFEFWKQYFEENA